MFNILHNKRFKFKSVKWWHIPFDLSAFKILIKKIFPPKKSVFTLDTTGDGKVDSIQLKVINLILPFVIPGNFEIGKFNLNSFDINNFNPSEYVKLFLDDNQINISKDSINLDDIKDRFIIYHGGESFKLEDILEGKLKGRTIALGDSISIIIKLDPETLEQLKIGKHFIKIESDLITNLIINFELDENNTNLKFDSNKI